MGQGNGQYTGLSVFLILYHAVLLNENLREILDIGF
jgi:hypothetical protein